MVFGNGVTMTGRMSLKNRISGRVSDSPMRVLIYGVEKVGKTTFAAGAPFPIFLGEEGASQLDVDRFPQPSSWQDILDAIQSLTVEEHDRQTLVFDTLDWMEPLCWQKTCQQHGKPSIEEFGYGKGYVAALDQWRELLMRLEVLRTTRRMNIIMVAHSMVKPFKNPDVQVGDFDRFELKVNPKAGALMKEWCDAVLFARHETLTKRDKNDRVRGVSTGVRLLQTEHCAAWDAGNRYGLPEQLPLSWDEFYAATKGPDSKQILAEIEELLSKVDGPTASLTREWLATPRRSKHLSEMLNRLRAKAPEEKNA